MGSWGDFNAQDVNKQYAITFKSPSYAMKEGTTESKSVLVELVKPSDESTSEPMEFTFLPRGQTGSPASQEKPRQEQKAPQQVYRPVSTMWQPKKEKEDAKNGWGLPPANPYNQDRQSCYQDLQQTNLPYIPNIPNPYPQPQGYAHHLGGSHGQHNLHSQDGRSPRQVHQPELCGFQGDLNEKNQSQMGGQSSNVGNIYGVPQPSPDSVGFADMKIRSPTSNSQQPAVDEDVEQISGKIDSISLSGAAPGSLSDCISLSLDMQQQHNLFGQVEEKRVSSKRGAKTAALESGSLVVPPVQGRFIETPEVSGQLNTPDTSANLTGSGYQLQNCAKVNFLG